MTGPSFAARSFGHLRAYLKRHVSCSASCDDELEVIMARTPYRTDLTDPQWNELAPLIPPAKPGGRPRAVDMREVINGIRYVLRTGCAWDHMPHDLPRAARRAGTTSIGSAPTARGATSPRRSSTRKG